MMSLIYTTQRLLQRRIMAFNRVMIRHSDPPVTYPPLLPSLRSGKAQLQRSKRIQEKQTENRQHPLPKDTIAHLSPRIPSHTFPQGYHRTPAVNNTIARLPSPKEPITRWPLPSCLALVRGTGGQRSAS
jgi:hypothetical protein